MERLCKNTMAPDSTQGPNGPTVPAFGFLWLMAFALILPWSAAHADWTNGRTLYLNGPPGVGLACQDCHGSPPSLFGISLAANNPSLIASQIQTYPPMMPFRGHLTSADLSDIAAYIASPSADPAAPPTCTLAANPASISAGGTSILTASCSPAATSYAWTGGSCAGTSSASCIVTPPATTSYTVTGSNAAGSSAQSSVTVTVNAVAPYTGLWWNPNESGWGMSVTQHGSINFVAIYTYDQAGQPTWYVMSSCPVSTSRCSGDLYRVTGGTPPTSPWNGSGKVLSAVGTGTLTFANADNATFVFLIDGAAGSKSISRQVFAAGGTPPAVDYSDLWWNPNESGWGVALTQQFGTIFATWYAYDASGKATWYVASNCAMASSGCSGDLYRVTGGTPPTSPWNGANIVVTAVGAVSITFTDASNGTMTYTINGVVGSRNITRQGF